MEVEKVVEGGEWCGGAPERRGRKETNEQDIGTKCASGDMMPQFVLETVTTYALFTSVCKR